MICMETEVALPFEIPATVQAREWLDELDWVDLHEGPLEHLQELAGRAPGDSARSWLQAWISLRTKRSQIEYMPPCVPVALALQEAGLWEGAVRQPCRMAGLGKCGDCDGLVADRQMLEKCQGIKAGD